MVVNYWPPYPDLFTILVFHTSHWTLYSGITGLNGASVPPTSQVCGPSYYCQFHEIKIKSLGDP